MQAAHELILLGGLLGLASLFAGVISSRLGAPFLLVFLVLGMVAGEDGPGGIQFEDFSAAYLIGSVALAIILFEGGIKTERATLRLAFWPALALGTVGVAISAGLVGVAAVYIVGAPWQEALLIGAAVAPTDAAAVTTLLRGVRVAVPHRLLAVLEVESGLNDPMSVFLTLLLVEALMQPGGIDARHALLSFAREMGGGLVLGLAGGFILLPFLHRLRTAVALYPVLALAAALALFGGAQIVGASGFLAVYLMGVVVGTSDQEAARAVEHFFEALAWLAQITLFVMLGLLVTPHRLVPMVVPTLALAAALIFVARPVAAAVCLLPFRFTPREIGFAAWVGLRGAVPIYLTIIPVLEGTPHAEVLFSAVFGIVALSLVIQGWTIAPAGRLFGFGKGGSV